MSDRDATDPVQIAWKRIESYVQNEATPVIEDLGGPCSEEDLAALEALLPELPAGYAASARRHDGFQSWVEGFRFLSSTEIAALAPSWQADPERAALFPIAEDGGGNYAAIELWTHEFVNVAHEEGVTRTAETFEEWLSWLSYVLDRDRPQFDQDGDVVAADGEFWEPDPDEDPEPSRADVVAWRAMAAEGVPETRERFVALFHTPDGSSFNRVRRYDEPTRLDWERLYTWADENKDEGTRVDAYHGLVQAGRYWPSVESSERLLQESPDDIVCLHRRGLVHLIEEEFEESVVYMDRVLARCEATGARSVRGLALASLGRREEAIAELRRSLASGDWLGGQDVARERLAELETSR